MAIRNVHSVRRQLRSDIERFDKMPAQIQDLLAMKVTEVVMDTAEEAKDYINNDPQSGTGRSWGEDFGHREHGFPGRTGSGEGAGGAGRSASGAMADDITWDVRKGKTIQGRIGWLRNYEDYYGAQNAGFVHNVTGQIVRGINLFSGLSLYLRDRLQQAANEIASRIDPWNVGVR